MKNNKLIPEGFKDHIDFNTNVEHEYKNKIIGIFIKNGFDFTRLVDHILVIDNNIV